MLRQATMHRHMKKSLANIITIMTKGNKLPLLLLSVLILRCTAVLCVVCPSGAAVPQQKPLLACCE